MHSRAISGIAMLAILTTLSACTPLRTTTPGTVGIKRSGLMLVSSSQMNNMANSNYEQTLRAAAARGALNKNPTQLASLRAIGKRLATQTAVFRVDAPSWDWQFNLIHEPTLNAWCMPGGKIVFYSGIIDQLQLSSDEIAAIMGHEIAHALREHGRERVSQQLLSQVGMDLLTIYSKANRQQLNQMGDIVKYGWLLPNSREQESESDRMGVELAARAGFNPKAAVRVWEKMRKQQQSEVPEWQSTHPAHETRISELQVYAEKVWPLYETARKRKT